MDVICTKCGKLVTGKITKGIETCICEKADTNLYLNHDAKREILKGISLLHLKRYGYEINKDGKMQCKRKTYDISHLMEDMEWLLNHLHLK